MNKDTVYKMTVSALNTIKNLDGVDSYLSCNNGRRRTWNNIESFSISDYGSFFIVGFNTEKIHIFKTELEHVQMNFFVNGDVEVKIYCKDEDSSEKYVFRGVHGVCS